MAAVTVHLGGSDSLLAGIDVGPRPTLKWFRRRAKHAHLQATLTPSPTVPFPEPLDRSEIDTAINQRGWIELPPKGRQ